MVAAALGTDADTVSSRRRRVASSTASATAFSRLMVPSNNGHRKVVMVVPMLIVPCHFQAAVAVRPRQR